MKVQTKDELARALATGDGLVIQECVATEHSEYTAGTLTSEGRCDASIVMRRDLRDGNTYRAYVEAFPELNVEVRRMAEALGSHGPANFQFRLDALGVRRSLISTRGSAARHRFACVLASTRWKWFSGESFAASRSSSRAFTP